MSAAGLCGSASQTGRSISPDAPPPPATSSCRHRSPRRWLGSTVCCRICSCPGSRARTFAGCAFSERPRTFSGDADVTYRKSSPVTRYYRLPIAAELVGQRDRGTLACRYCIFGHVSALPYTMRDRPRSHVLSSSTPCVLMALAGVNHGVLGFVSQSIAPTAVRSTCRACLRTCGTAAAAEGLSHPAAVRHAVKRRRFDSALGCASAATGTNR